MIMLILETAENKLRKKLRNEKMSFENYPARILIILSPEIAGS